MQELSDVTDNCAYEEFYLYLGLKRLISLYAYKAQQLWRLRRQFHNFSAVRFNKPEVLNLGYFYNNIPLNTMRSCNRSRWLKEKPMGHQCKMPRI